MEQKIYYNGTIFTMDDAVPTAKFVVTQGDRIAVVQTDGSIEDYIAQGAQPVDLHGTCMLPGFIDSHIHMLTAALNRRKLDISDMFFDTVSDMLDYVYRQTKSVNEPWVSVFGFSEENIKDNRMVTRWDIDAVFPEKPVTIIRVCGHMCIVNSAVIERLDKSRMESIVGGEFKKDTTGEYTGLATEGAQQYVLDSMPQVDEQTVIAYLRNEQDLLIKNGITAIHDAGTDMMLPKDYVRLYEKAENSGKLRIRTYLMVRPEEDESFTAFDCYLRELKERYAGNNFLRFGSVKLFADGSLGSATAAIKFPYEGQEDNLGLLLNVRLDQYVVKSADAGHQVAVHTIGDRGTEYVSNLYAQSALKKQDRLRLEHAELLDTELIDQIRENELLVMTQPIFIREFGSTYFKRLGEERAMHIQPLKTLLDKGIMVGFGTDYPVDDPNPLLGIHAAMTREIKGSDKSLNEAEKIDFLRAVKCYTLTNAYSAFQEKEMGSIETGKYADFVILSGLKYDDSGAVFDVSQAKVEQTVIGGKTAYLAE